ncbi:MAG: glycosyltransferase family 39 protein [Bdellovibrionaceae bacterium]|nr:glycosyltransferase family 39 protein [Pseudobdellovibrionaceae bacterium]
MTWFARLWWLSLLIKLVLAAILPLAADEAYYWVWSHHLQWSYFDHPPLVAWVLWPGHLFENFFFAVRWPAVLLGHATLLVWFLFLKEKLSDAEMKLWMWLALLTPFLGIGSLIVTPDVPVLFFWALSLLFYQRALQKKSATWYIALGAALGLGFCSKYHIVLIVPVFLMDLIFEKKGRDIRWKFIPLTVLTGLLFTTPVLYWNATNDWASFRFQLNHGFSGGAWNPEWTLSYILSQILFFGPLLIPAFVRGFRDRNLRLLSWNALFSWSFFLYSSFKSVVEGNWPIIGYAPAYAVAAKGTRSAKWVYITVGFWSVATLIFLSHWLVPWFPENEKIDETHQYRSLAAITQRYTPIYANTYQMASILSFETKKLIPKLRGMSRYDFYDEMPASMPDGRSFYLIKREGQGLSEWLQSRQTQVEIVEKWPPNFEVLKITLL